MIDGTSNLSSLELDPIAQIVPQADGRFSYAPDDDGLCAKQLQVIENGELLDVIAWPLKDSSGWFCLHDTLSHIGAYELRTAWWQDRPAIMVATPQDYLDREGECFCIFDWSADLSAIFGAASAVDCATPELAAKLYRTLLQQAMPRIAITVSGKPWRPAT